MKYGVDANGNPVADPTQRSSFDFAQGALSSGATPDQIVEGLSKFSTSLTTLDRAPGSLGDTAVGSRVNAALTGSELGDAGPSIQADGSLSITVYLGDEPSGSDILQNTVVGGAQLLVGANQLYQENANLATALYGGVKAVLGGGPVKTVALQLAKFAESDLINRVAGEAGHYARDIASGVAYDFATSHGIELQGNIAGQNVSFGPQNFADIAGEFAGGAVETIVGGTIKGIADRGAQVNNIVRYGRRGSPATQADIDVQRDRMLQQNPGWEHIGGGTDANTGLPLPETYRAPQGGTRAVYPDLTFRKPDGSYHYHNTVDSNAAGLPTPREADALRRLGILRRPPAFSSRQLWNPGLM